MTTPLPELPRDATTCIFDICGTLFRSNTTMDFLNWVTSARAGSRLRFHGWRLLAALARRSGAADPAAHVRLRIRALRGYSRAELEAAAARFVQDWLMPRRRPEVWTLLEQAQSSGRRVVLASFTLDVIAEALAARLGVREVVASRLAYTAAGRCTGRYAGQVHGPIKAAKLTAMLSTSVLEGAWYITDDASADADLLGCIRYPVVVAPDAGEQPLSEST